MGKRVGEKNDLWVTCITHSAVDLAFFQKRPSWACLAPCMEVSRSEAPGVLLCTFPSAATTVQPLSLSNLLPFMNGLYQSCVLCLAQIAIKTLATAITSHTPDLQSFMVICDLSQVLPMISTMVTSAVTHPSQYLSLQAPMDPSGSDDNKCLSVQLDGSDMAPNAAKVIFHYLDVGTHLIPHQLDCPPTEVSNEVLLFGARWLAIELGESNGSVHQVAPCMMALATRLSSLFSAVSILAFLHPHTSSPSMPLVAHAMTSLMASDFSEEELNQILNTQLYSLAISPQVKQNIIPGLLSIAKLATRMQLQGSNLSILMPPTVPQVKTGHLYVHLDASRDVFQYWIFTNHWECVQSGVEYPLNHDQVLAIHANGEPSWVTRASTITTKMRKEKEIREQLVQGPWRFTVLRSQNMGMLHLEKSWWPIMTLEVDGQHRDEVMLGIDSQNPNQREIMLLHHAHHQMQIKLDIWHKLQSKAKSWKHRHLVMSTSMALGNAIKKQVIELHFSSIPAMPSLSYPH
ncbi:hypothetical protein H4582DRAFT_2053994 [Lactarius indigo]|nr:hypothetical protein H4582DRAFT_2053994 [Lactarius indigo]